MDAGASGSGVGHGQAPIAIRNGSPGCSRYRAAGASGRAVHRRLRPKIMLFYPDEVLVPWGGNPATGR
jgi:hypothetical protein